MTDRRISRAIVLAAGASSRLSEGGDLAPKPLRSVASVPLLVRVLRTLQTVGVQEAVIVTGFGADRVRRVVLGEPSLGLKVTFVHNPEYAKKNGVSLLAARKFVDRECLLTMGDHLYSPELVRRLLAVDLPARGCALAVDSDIEGCFDVDDATKVVTSKGAILDIGKELDGYDCVDTGVFRIDRPLITELDRLYSEFGDCSLSEGVRALCRRARFVACDVGDVRWIDVDTPAAGERAEAMLRVFGDALGDEPGAGTSCAVDPDAIELFSPSWVRAAKPYNEDHFAVADQRSDLLRLMSNESPFDPSPRVLNAILEAATRGNYYPGGARELRKKLGARDGMDESQVLLGAGSTELIDVIVRTFVAPGEEVLLGVPTFSMYEARTRCVGGIPILVPMTDEHEHDVPGLIRAVTERTKVIFLCSPNNPTGNRIAEADLRRILRLGLPTVIDEAYYELSDESASCVHLLSEYPNAILLRTFSKAYGLAGLRLGYAFGHASVVRLLSRVKVPWNIPEITLAAASAALDDRAEFNARLGELRAGRDALVRRVSRVPGLHAMPSEGNFVLIDISHTGATPEQFVQSMLKEGVLIRSLAVHHAARSYVRITVGTLEQNDRCAAALERVAARLRSAREVTASSSPYASVTADAE